MVTQAFRDLITKLNDGKGRVAIDGPKGVGKSLALGAIGTLCKKAGRPCILVSPKTEVNDEFRSYVEEIFTEFSKYQYAIPNQVQYF